MDAEEALGQMGRVQIVDRSFLPNFVFAPEDTVVTLGQDGLVANTLKYLDGQPVVGVNPDPERWDGRLLPFRVRDLAKLMPEVVLRKRSTHSVTMAKATLNNGQTLYGVNDLFIGPKTHTSARYFIRYGKAGETHSSSGVIVSTGMGATGWLKSLLTGAGAVAMAVDHRGKNNPQQPDCYDQAVAGFKWESDYLYFTVREPFPTRTTGASLVFGRVTKGTPLILESQMAENGVIFSDGIEKDFLEFNSGTQAVIGIAEKKGVLVE
jgi:hypothetical protein